MSEARETAWKYTREYIRLRKQTNQLLREGKIDKQDADHRTANAKQFLLFAKFQLENGDKTSTPVLPGTSSSHEWKLEGEDKWHSKER